MNFGFNDVFRNDFIENFFSSEVTISVMILTLILSAILAIYIFFVYVVFAKKSFYSRNFNISLIGIAIITSAIILSIQSSIVISLGMVGALSIVRFRTAIKEPIDLMFLFWSISVGIICGAKLPQLAILLSIILTICLLVLNKVPVKESSMLLIVNSSNIDIEKQVLSVIKELTYYYKVKSRNLTAENIDMTIEIRTSKDKEIIKKITEIDKNINCSVVSYDNYIGL